MAGNNRRQTARHQRRTSPTKRRRHRRRNRNPVPLLPPAIPAIHESPLFADRLPLEYRAAAVAVLLGATAAAMLLGLPDRFSPAFGETVMTKRSVLAGSFLVLSLGVRMPQRFSLWCLRTVSRGLRLSGAIARIPPTWVDPEPANPALYWMIQAVLALLAGVWLVLTPISSALVCDVYFWWQDHFVWSRIPELLLVCATASVAVAPALLTLGAAISCSHHLNRQGTWDQSITLWHFAGAFLALAGAWWFPSLAFSSAMLPAAALPALIAAIISGLTGPISGVANPQESQNVAVLPTWSDPHPRLLRLGLVTLGIAGAVMLLGTAAFPNQTAKPVQGASLIGILATTLGYAAGVRFGRFNFPSLQAFGMILGIAGLNLLFGAARINPSSASRVIPLILLAACMGAVGFAMGVGMTILLHRVACRSTAGALILGRMSLGTAGVLLLSECLNNSSESTFGWLALLGIFLITIGGWIYFSQRNFLTFATRSAST